MTKFFFVLCFALAAAVTIVKYVYRVEGTWSEKYEFTMRTAKQVVLGKSAPKYKGRHWYDKKALSY